MAEPRDSGPEPARKPAFISFSAPHQAYTFEVGADQDRGMVALVIRSERGSPLRLLGGREAVLELALTLSAAAMRLDDPYS